MADSARASPHPCRGPPQSRSAGSVVRHHPPGWLATCGGTPERKCILDMPIGTRSHFFNTAGNFPKSHQLQFRLAPFTGLRGLPPCSDGCEVAPDLGVSRVSFVAGVCLRCTSTVLTRPAHICSGHVRGMNWVAFVVTRDSHSASTWGTQLTPARPLPILGTCASPHFGTVDPTRGLSEPWIRQGHNV